MIIRKLLNYWFSKKRDNFYLFLAVLFIGLYGAGICVKLYDLDSLSQILKASGFAGFLFVMVLVLVHMNLHANHEFLKLFQNQSHFPQKQIEHVNSFCMTVFLGITILSMIALALFMELLWGVIKSWFSGLSQILPTQSIVLPDETAHKVPPGPDLASIFGTSAPPPAWMELIDQLFSIVGYLVVIGVCFSFLRIICLSVWNWITKPRHFDEDEKIYLRPTLFMSAEKKPSRQTQGLAYQLSYSGKIRRYYRKKILSRHRKASKHALPPVWASPQELEKASGMEDRTLHEIYEKARYSRQGGDENDWKRISNRL